MRWENQPHDMPRHLRRALPALVLFALALWLCFPFAGASAAASTPALPPDASCARLAHADPTATNGAQWGETLLPGQGASGGWFGVSVCGNSVNEDAPGGANLSCDRTPRDFATTGCAPGAATSDGYGLTFQCVELVKRFAAWAFDVSPAAWKGDAATLWLREHHPGSFSAFVNGGERAPVPGDVLVWGSVDNQGRPWPEGPAGGHVAVVAAVGGGHISFVEQNMLGHRAGVAINIPEERTTLTESASGHWTIGPTYGTNGGRTLYGWLHEAGNTGQFTREGAVTPTPDASAPPPSSPPPIASPIASPTSPPSAAPGSPPGSPSGVAQAAPPGLASGALVVGVGALARERGVVWV